VLRGAAGLNEDLILARCLVGLQKLRIEIADGPDAVPQRFRSAHGNQKEAKQLQHQHEEAAKQQKQRQNRTTVDCNMHYRGGIRIAKCNQHY
jgi:ABC-type Zn2+ transport system substrate-binding protein/surface adhesin